MEDTSQDFVVEEPSQGMSASVHVKISLLRAILAITLGCCAAKQRGGTPRETDARRLEQRQKQVDLGKNTLAYQRYAESVPK